MRIWVESWDPAYAAAGDGGGTGPAEASTAHLDTDLELPASQWAPVAAPPDLRPPATVLLVDGVRRTDATLWTGEDDGSSYPGLAVSYAAGVVRCDLHAGAAALAGVQVARGLFTASPGAADLDCGTVRYQVHRVTAGELPQLSAAVQGPLTRLETTVASRARDAVADPGDLLILDGPLRGRGELPRALGYVKTHERRYLPPELTSVVTSLPPGHRSPVFTMGTSWPCHSWYLRLPGGSGAPWSGLVRLECAADLPVEKARALADLSVVTLPGFAATAYKDPRAPQNLVPIGGLEKRLRARLGDPNLLHRALRRAAAAAAPANAI